MGSLGRGGDCLVLVRLSLSLTLLPSFVVWFLSLALALTLLSFYVGGVTQSLLACVCLCRVYVAYPLHVVHYANNQHKQRSEKNNNNNSNNE